MIPITRRDAQEGASATTPEKSEEILQRYLAWLDIERLNVAHRIGSYSVQEIHGLERGCIGVKAFRDIGTNIADMALPELVARAVKNLVAVNLSPTGPSVEEEVFRRIVDRSGEDSS